MKKIAFCDSHSHFRISHFAIRTKMRKCDSAKCEKCDAFASHSHRDFAEPSHSHRICIRFLRSRRIRIAFAFEDECEFTSLLMTLAGKCFALLRGQWPQKWSLGQSAEQILLSWATWLSLIFEFECECIRKDWRCRRTCQNVLKMSTFCEKCPSTKITKFSFFGKNYWTKILNSLHFGLKCLQISTNLIKCHPRSSKIILFL